MSVKGRSWEAICAEGNEVLIPGEFLVTFTRDTPPLIVDRLYRYEEGGFLRTCEYDENRIITIGNEDQRARLGYPGEPTRDRLWRARTTREPGEQEHPNPLILIGPMFTHISMTKINHWINDAFFGVIPGTYKPHKDVVDKPVGPRTSHKSICKNARLRGHMINDGISDWLESVPNANDVKMHDLCRYIGNARINARVKHTLCTPSGAIHYKNNYGLNHGSTRYP